MNGKKIDKKLAPYKFVNQIMNQMEEEKYSVGEAEYIVRKLKDEMEKNSERIRQEKPFAVHRY